MMDSLARSDLRHQLRRSMLPRDGFWRAPIAIFAVTVLLVVTMKPLLDGEVSSGMLFMLGITLVGARAGLVPALIAALLASAIFNFYLADPALAFRMSSGEDLAPPVIFTACAVISGLLAGRLRDKTFQLAQSNLQLESLLETSRLLQAAPDANAIQAALARTVPGRLGFTLSLFTVRDGKAHPFTPSTCRPELLVLADAAVAGRAASDGGNSAYRLDGTQACVGALVVENTRDAKVDRAFLEALASLVGLALERSQLASVIAESEANHRTEELKNALLSSVSHDLRTPLTTISASASSLIEYGHRFDDATAHNLLQGIVDECNRLNRFTANLLELSRLQSGGASLSGQILSVQDVARAAVQRLRPAVGGREVTLAAPPEDILVKADTALFDLALINVIQNALLYSDDAAPVAVHIARDGQRHCLLTISDQGCGIPPAEQTRVFERFYRVKRSEPSPQGSGLGLAIAKGFVEAFGGSIEITSPAFGKRGTSIAIRLPVIEEPEA